MKNNYILSENLIHALKIAIQTQEEGERQRGYFTDSALLAGWKISLKSLEEVGTLEIR